MIEPLKGIHVLMTGGTIDSHWSGSSDTVVPFEHSVIPDYVKTLKLSTPIEFTEICMKDSRQLGTQDMETIAQTIEASPHRGVIVTHGTYTMVDTARYIQAHVTRKDQVVVLTGSMTPLKGFDASDAPFNLGFAFASIQTLEPGVYVAMNGQIFTPEEVMKNMLEGKFVSIFQNQQ